MCNYYNSIYFLNNLTVDVSDSLKYDEKEIRISLIHNPSHLEVFIFNITYLYDIYQNIGQLIIQIMYI